MHAEARAFVESTLPTLPIPARAVELGGRNFNGGVRDLFVHVPSYTSIDLLPGLNVDVVADAGVWQPEAPVDAVVCCEVLEHAPNAEAIVHNAYRMLAPGGWFLITCASPPRAPHSGIDGLRVRPGEYYGNVEPEWLAQWLAAAGFCDVYVAWHPHGDVYATAMRKP